MFLLCSVSVHTLGFTCCLYATYYYYDQDHYVPRMLQLSPHPRISLSCSVWSWRIVAETCRSFQQRQMTILSHWSYVLRYMGMIVRPRQTRTFQSQGALPNSNVICAEPGADVRRSDLDEKHLIILVQSPQNQRAFIKTLFKQTSTNKTDYKVYPSAPSRKLLMLKDVSQSAISYSSRLQ